jgi:hypothetical protein
MYHNTAPTDANIRIYGGTFDYNCTTPAVGANCITNEPAFIDHTGADYHVYQNSVIVDSGSDAYVSANTDLDGRERIQGASVDMGAYEYGSAD